MSYQQKAVYIKPLGIAIVLDGTMQSYRFGGFHQHDDLERLYLDDRSTDEEWHEKAVWGTFGKDGDQPLRYLKVKHLDPDHLLAILMTQKHLRGSKLGATIKYWLDKKTENLP